MADFFACLGAVAQRNGVGNDDFIKRITVQELTPAGLSDLGLTARTLARLESLDAHAHAVQVRLDAIARDAMPADAAAQGVVK